MFEGRGVEEEGGKKLVERKGMRQEVRGIREESGRTA